MSKWARSWACGLIGVLSTASIGLAQDAPQPKVVSPDSIVGPSVLGRIREEGLNHSHAMETLSYLSDVIGPRLTGSPNLRHANEWTRSQFTQWGLENVHDEAWGPFGRGWELKRFSVQVIEPQAITLIAYPKAWSPGLDEPVEAPVVWVDARTEADLKKYEGKLKGAVVLMGSVRPVEARFEPLAARVNDSDLLSLADATTGTTSPPGVARAANAAERSAQFANTPAGGRILRGRRGGGGADPTTGPTTGPAGGRRGRGGLFGNPLSGRILTMAQKEGAALVIDSSTQGDGGTVFVAQATVPSTQPATGFGGGAGARRAQPYAVDCPPMPPEATMAVEHFNRLIRMIQQGQELKMAVDFKVKYHADDLMAYNTIAEIPGNDPDLKDQIVMVGGHMDSWQSGTGATDNGVGVVAAMEAVRIIKALDLKPRRTIRIALWTGEEEGLLGSQAYVAKHFGHFGPLRTGATTRPAGGGARGGAGPLVKEAEYDKLSCYFNLDNGTGKIRGVYMQANDAARPYFAKWIAPWGDLEARTITPSNTGSTDHISFDTIGLPGFQFIQDPIEYFSRTHHSSADVFDRIQADDLKQASTVMAAFLFDAAQMDERFPRKPMRNRGE